LPTAIYALFGSSRVLAVGPVAMVSLLVASGVAPVAGNDPVLYAAYASILMLLVGVIQMGMGFAKLGFTVKYLSHPVLMGFSWAAALIIGVSQLKHVLGIDLQRSHHIHQVIGQALSKANETHGLTLLFASVTIGLLMVLKKVVPGFPRFLLVVVIGTTLAGVFGLDQAGLATVGAVPSGLPSLTIPVLDWVSVTALLPTAVTISLVGFMESIAVAKNFARGTGKVLDADTELRALGLANLGGAFFQGYPVTGGFSRTAVNAEAGAVTTLASLTTAIVVAISLLLFTPLFFFMPKAVLAGIIITAVLGLIDIAEARHLWSVSRQDLFFMAVTFLATLTFGIEIGIGIGVAASLLGFIARSAHPHVAILGRLPGSTNYRNVERFPDAETTEGVIALRVDGPLFFANSIFLADTISGFISDRHEQVTDVVLDAGGIGSVDASAVAAIGEIARDLDAQGMRFWLCTVRGPVRDALKGLELGETLPAHQMVQRLHDAMEAMAGGPVQPLGGWTPKEA